MISTRDEIDKLLEPYPFVLGAKDLMKILGIGKDAVYPLLKSGNIKTVQFGKNYRVSKPSFAKYLEEL